MYAVAAGTQPGKQGGGGLTPAGALFDLIMCWAGIPARPCFSAPSPLALGIELGLRAGRSDLEPITGIRHTARAAFCFWCSNAALLELLLTAAISLMHM
jgi:hypothetical protein